MVIDDVDVVILSHSVQQLTFSDCLSLTMITNLRDWLLTFSNLRLKCYRTPSDVWIGTDDTPSIGNTLSGIVHRKTPHLTVNMVDTSLDITHNVVSLWGMQSTYNEEYTVDKQHLIELLMHLKDNFTDSIVSLHTTSHVANIHINNLECSDTHITITDGVFQKPIPIELITDAKFYKEFDPA